MTTRRSSNIEAPRKKIRNEKRIKVNKNVTGLCDSSALEEVSHKCCLSYDCEELGSYQEMEMFALAQIQNTGLYLLKQVKKKEKSSNNGKKNKVLNKSEQIMFLLKD